MRIFVISDNIDTLTGLRLAGIEGVVVHKQDELKAALKNVLEQRDIGLVLITEHLSMSFPSLVNEVRLNNKQPLFLEIPDRHGSGRQSDFITKYIREALGVKLDK